MTEGLRSTFEAACERALAWRDGEDPTPVLSALALAGALELVGALAGTDRRAREKLLSTGARALLALGPPPAGDDDEADARSLAAMLARRGLRALRGEPAPDRARSDVRPPSERELVQLFSGRGEPLTLAEIAWRARGSTQALAELRFLARRAADRARTESTEAPHLRLAADDGAPMLDPSLGTRVAAVTDEAGRDVIELVLFPGEPARVAAYASDALPVRIAGEGVVGEAARAGYAVARILARDAARLALEITVGDRRYAVEIDPRGATA